MGVRYFHSQVGAMSGFVSSGTVADLHSCETWSQTVSLLGMHSKECVCMGMCAALLLELRDPSLSSVKKTNLCIYSIKNKLRARE